MIYGDESLFTREHFEAHKGIAPAHRCELVVYCLELPEGFPLGMEIREGAQITGFYFPGELIGLNTEDIGNFINVMLMS